MYRHRKQRPNTAKLPKVLRDELVSLGIRSKSKFVTDLSGKLEPQKGVRKYSQGGRNDKTPFGTRGTSKFSAKGGVIGRQQQQKSRNVMQRTLQNSDEADSLDEEDLRIVELEKKLGMGKEKKSQVDDDGLDGTCKVFLN